MKTVNIITLIVVALLIIIGVYFIVIYQSPTPATTIVNNTTNSTTSTATLIVNPEATSTASATQTILIQGFNFIPATVTIPTGTKVIWTNQDSVPHQIKSVSFNSQPLNTGDSFSFTFTKKGTYNYTCAIHPSMKGSIVVQ